MEQFGGQEAIMRTNDDALACRMYKDITFQPNFGMNKVSRLAWHNSRPFRPPLSSHCHTKPSHHTTWYKTPCTVLVVHYWG